MLLSVVVTGIDPLVDSLMMILVVVLEVSISDLVGALDFDVNSTNGSDES